jgi:hypothetical protein
LASTSRDGNTSKDKLSSAATPLAAKIWLFGYRGGALVVLGVIGCFDFEKMDRRDEENDEYAVTV